MDEMLNPGMVGVVHRRHPELPAQTPRKFFRSGETRAKVSLNIFGSKPDFI
jgi:hypothetical protein